jgi:hypothetical protein
LLLLELLELSSIVATGVGSVVATVCAPIAGHDQTTIGVGIWCGCQVASVRTRGVAEPVG